MKSILTKLNSYDVETFGTVYTCMHSKLVRDKILTFSLQRINSDVVKVLELEFNTIENCYSVRSTNKFLIADFLLDGEEVEVVLDNRRGCFFTVTT